MMINWSLFRRASSPAVAPVAVPWGFRPRIAVPGSASGSAPVVSVAGLAGTATGAGIASGAAPAISLIGVYGTAADPSVVFVATDTTTQGTWLGVYGSLGYYKLVGAGPSLESSLPAGMTITPSNAAVFSWESASSDVRDLQRADGSTRDADTWFTGGTMTFAVAPADSLTRRLRIYCLDWPDTPTGTITQTVAILSGDDHTTVLDSRIMSAFAQGTWLSWDATGPVDVQVAYTSGGPIDALLGGIFFDPPGGAGNASGTAPAVSLGATGATATGAGSTSGTAPAVSLAAPAGTASGTTAGSASGTAPSLGTVAIATAVATGAASVTGTPSSITLSAPAGSAGTMSPGNATGIAPSVSLVGLSGTVTGAVVASGTAPALSFTVPTGSVTGAAVVSGLPAGIGLAAVAGTTPVRAGDLVEALQLHFQASPDLAALTSDGRLWELEAPEGVEYPFAVFFRVSEPVSVYTTAGYLPEATVQFSFHASTVDEARDMLKAFRDAFTRAPLVVSGMDVLHVLPGEVSAARGEGKGPRGQDPYIAMIEFTILMIRDY